MSYPPEFDCQITLSIMTDPVMDDIGMTYDRKAILQWLSENNNRHPIDRSRILTPEMLKTNYALKSQIDRYLSTAGATATATATATTSPFKQHPLSLKASRFTHNQQKFVNVEVEPPSTGKRQPVVMFLAVDNSGSMGENATESTEGDAFTRMDLCKHTIRTIAGMLNSDDILCLTTFSTKAKVVMKPMLMNPEGKARLETVITTIHPDSQTNIWAALELVNHLASAPEFEGRNVVTALLTDGMPNIDPPRGILPTFKNLKKPAMFALSTFGFGYNLDSNMLSELASLGGGSFGFIPDYSMVATVFINWAATVLATAATSQKLLVTYADGTSGEVLTGPIQFGQNRNFILPETKPIASVSLCNNTVVPVVSPPNNQLLAYKDLVFAIQKCLTQGGTNTFDGLYEKYAQTEGLELVKDVKPSQDPSEMGQVIMAPSHYNTWGKHYLRAYLRAQEFQQCMNFKDPGLQMYGGELFHTGQKIGDEVFAHLPPLDATGYKSVTGAATATATAINMATAFNNPRGGCWAPGSLVLMDDGSFKPIEDVRKDDKVWTPVGPATVEYALELGTRFNSQSMCKLKSPQGDLWITPYHPVLQNNKWQFPADLAPITERLQSKVYNLILNQGHVVNVSGILSCTLGHGLKGDVIEHPYFGDKENVLRDIKNVSGYAEGRPVFTNLVQFKKDGLVSLWFNDA